MKRPTFTDKEELLIAHVRYTDSVRGDRLAYYGTWVVVSSVMFVYGLWDGSKPLLLTAFLLVWCPLLRFVYYQFAPSCSFKPIVDKYEAAFREGEAPAPAEPSPGPPVGGDSA